MIPPQQSDNPASSGTTRQDRPPDEGKPGAWAPFSHPNYRLFFGGQLISLIGTWTQNVAQAWLIYRITRSGLHLGLVAFAGQVPVLALALLGGTLADRLDRRRVLVGTQSAAMLLAFVLSALTLSHLVREWHVLSLAFLLGLVNAVDMPTRQSFVAEMVDRQVLHQAIGLNSSMFNGARMIGPALAGWLVAAVGEGWCFFINGVSFLAVIVGLLLMRLPGERVPARANEGSTFAQMKEGVSHAWQDPTLRGLLAMLGLSSLLGAPYLVIMPIFAEQVLGGGPQTLGMLMAASGVGALLAALHLATRRGTGGLQRRPYAAAMGLGLCLVLFSLSDRLWLSLALLAPTGFCLLLQTASTNSVLQLLAPDHLRGRIMAVYVMMFMGAMPIGSLLAGALTRHLGVALTMRLGGVACLLVALALFLVRLRQGPHDFS